MRRGGGGRWGIAPGVSWEDEEESGEERPSDAEGADDAEAFEGGVGGESEGSEAADRGQAAEENRFDDRGEIFLAEAGLAHGDDDIDAVIDADAEDEGEGEDIKKIEGDIEAFESGDEGTDGEGEAEHEDGEGEDAAVEEDEEEAIEENHEGGEFDHFGF